MNHTTVRECKNTDATGIVIIENNVVRNVVSAARFAFAPNCAAIDGSDVAEGNTKLSAATASHKGGILKRRRMKKNIAFPELDQGEPFMILKGIQY